MLGPDGEAKWRWFWHPFGKGARQDPESKRRLRRSAPTPATRAGKHLGAGKGPRQQMELGATDCASDERNGASIIIVILKRNSDC